ncbi:hypothetical protein EMQ25_07810 [Arsenicitalea aurantiaca]|uniref:Uncharacterized protein n=1 Tax=Arsenicitalea aurantiaca TaxID=1783274 RepID=A0A433XG55_9HYPH|nr:hypothetical protein [Arsenicitalea aurantiaca]RUT33022.1 hypothetical protein EMQ25_07810 [Arsenicitalea aurantiaca]
MMRISAIIALALLAGLGPAYGQSRCPSEPETARSGYVANNVQRSLCLQRELSDGTQRLQDLARIQSQINASVQQMEMQRRLSGF